MSYVTCKCVHVPLSASFSLTLSFLRLHEIIFCMPYLLSSLPKCVPHHQKLRGLPHGDVFSHAEYFVSTYISLSHFHIIIRIHNEIHSWHDVIAYCACSFLFSAFFSTACFSAFGEASFSLETFSRWFVDVL